MQNQSLFFLDTTIERKKRVVPITEAITERAKKHQQLLNGRELKTKRSVVK